MPGRIVIISDLHLGRPSCAAHSAAALRPLWDAADHLIVNGDAAEIHHPRHWPAAARQMLQLFDLCEADGVELTLLSGNHDPYITDLRHLHLADGLIFVTHGDVLHPAIAPWSPAAARMRRAAEAALAALRPEERSELEARLAICQHASFTEWEELAARYAEEESRLSRLEDEAAHSTLRGMFMRPWLIIRVLQYWRTIPKLAAGFLKRHAPEARFIVLGHTHHAGVWHVDGRTVINTGSFGFPGRPRAVIIENGALSVVPVHRRRDEYHLAPRPARRFPLPDVESSASSGKAPPPACVAPPRRAASG